MLQHPWDGLSQDDIDEAFYPRGFEWYRDSTGRIRALPDAGCYEDPLSVLIADLEREEARYS